LATVFLGCAFGLPGCALLGGGSEDVPTGVDGEVRYRGRKDHVLVISTEPPVMNAVKESELNETRSPGEHQAKSRGSVQPSVRSEVTPTHFAALFGDLDSAGFFKLPVQSGSRPDPFPAFTLEVARKGQPARRVSLNALTTREQADAFAASAGYVVKAGTRR
jgi:hypothetical protein